MSWATEEMADTDLGDKRLDTRLKKLLEDLSMRHRKVFPPLVKVGKKLKRPIVSFVMKR